MAKKTVNMSIRIDPELRSRFSELCIGAGVTASRALTMFMERSVREGMLPLGHLTSGGGGPRYALVRIDDAAGE